MPTRSLSASNRYLRKATASKQVVDNVSSSTAIETGKPASVYVTRYAKSGRFVAESNSALQKK